MKKLKGVNIFKNKTIDLYLLMVVKSLSTWINFE